MFRAILDPIIFSPKSTTSNSLSIMIGTLIFDLRMRYKSGRRIEESVKIAKEGPIYKFQNLKVH